MSLANYTVPFAPPVATPYLPSPGFGISGTPALNSLLYDRHNSRHAPAPPLAHTSPNRKQPPANDPYRNQYSSRQRHYNYASRKDRYYSAPDYVNDKKVTSAAEEEYSSREPQVKYYADNGKPQSSLPPRRTQKRKSADEDQQDRNWPIHPPGYTRISNTFNSVPEPGAKTSIHAVLDFDDDFEDYSYEDDGSEPRAPVTSKTHVTPIEGPILLKNGSVPVVPLYSYPTVNNGSLVQIPVSIDFYEVPAALKESNTGLQYVPSPLYEDLDINTT